MVFSSPQLAYVGKHEAAAVQEYGDVDVYTSTSTWVPWPLRPQGPCTRQNLQGWASAGPFLYSMPTLDSALAEGSCVRCAVQ